MKACLTFVDESGFLMAPLVRRSWAPHGRTPVLRQRTRHHQKLSAIAALCLTPEQDRASLYFRLHPGINIRGPQVLGFLRCLASQVGRPLFVVWDRLQVHRSRLVQSFLSEREDFDSEFLPPYAPDLNPVEYLWAYLKTNPLANHTPMQLDDLTRDTRRHGRIVQRKDDLLWSFVRHSPLFFRPE